MNVGVAYAKNDSPVWLKLVVDEGARVRDVIEQSGILERFPEIDLENRKIGIFGKLTRLDAEVNEGDRIEIYRPITCDPDEVRARVEARRAAADA